MVNWIKERIEKLDINTIVENLLEELVSKDSSNQYGMDNMSAILIKFIKKK
jgi:serine/threonine protein phosphatase PrpC